MDLGRQIYDQARAEGMPPALAALIVAQARHESANFTSNVFRKCGNLFGYKAVYSAPKCILSPESDYYKKYNAIADSVKEVTDWIKRRQREGRFPADLRAVDTPEVYARLLKQSGYYGAPESEYSNALARWLQPYPEKKGSGFIFLGLAALATYGLWKKR
jgi:uncharacterized FlgJ-related protein